MELGKAQLTGDCCGPVTHSGGFVVMPLPLSLQYDMYGHARLHIYDDKRGEWNRMRTEDADRIVRLLEDLRCLVRG